MSGFSVNGVDNTSAMVTEDKDASFSEDSALQIRGIHSKDQEKKTTRRANISSGDSSHTEEINMPSIRLMENAISTEKAQEKVPDISPVGRYTLRSRSTRSSNRINPSNNKVPALQQDDVQISSSGRNVVRERAMHPEERRKRIVARGEERLQRILKQSSNYCFSASQCSGNTPSLSFEPDGTLDSNATSPQNRQRRFLEIGDDQLQDILGQPEDDMDVVTSRPFMPLESTLGKMPMNTQAGESSSANPGKFLFHAIPYPCVLFLYGVFVYIMYAYFVHQHSEDYSYMVPFYLVEFFNFIVKRDEHGQMLLSLETFTRLSWSQRFQKYFFCPFLQMLSHFAVYLLSICFCKIFFSF